MAVSTGIDQVAAAAATPGILCVPRSRTYHGHLQSQDIVCFKSAIGAIHAGIPVKQQARPCQQDCRERDFSNHQR